MGGEIEQRTNKQKKQKQKTKNGAITSNKQNKSKKQTKNKQQTNLKYQKKKKKEYCFYLEIFNRIDKSLICSL
ncbi:hypothetical protein RFI_18837 [Reticulomyxa filosa]|uniref:Uncharacterized protein n=1 Tax=Reticulomyxa filosa TaxID=46433 RepID=X6MXA1_RETFI|nr:hypothetical protein RFI_18837 [Reticulomyxa filosa]|eukprot:ETO18429.1 hypothetical protein RFI_18837 [Reticulomyxa filosa]